MLFHSAAFLAFLPTVLGVFLLLPTRIRPAWVLLASLAFYGHWRLAYLPLLLISTGVDFVAGRRIHASHDPTTRRAWLAASLLVNLGILFTFKYAGFAAENLGALARVAGWGWHPPVPDWVLPVGISFYTFQSMSYSIDVYRGRVEPEKSPVRFATYVAFFPQLVAGPIERSASILPQLGFDRRVPWEERARGLRLVAWGFFKKLVIADGAAPFVAAVFDAPAMARGGEVWLASYLFAFQIFCDFSGYSDIARGVAALFGVRLMRNFERPYLAPDLVQFWREWHVSLSTWFRDYVYIPLGGSRRGLARTLGNTWVVFLVSGLWHGASWTFVAWGALHAAGFTLLTLLRSLRAPPAPPGPLGLLWRRLVTFHFVVLAWVFFRAPSFPVAGELLTRMLADPGLPRLGYFRQPFALATTLAAIGFLLLVQLRGPVDEVFERLRQRSRTVRFGFWYLVLLTTLVLGRFTSREFLYFQF